MYAISLFFLGTVFYGLIGPEAVDLVKMPFGLDLPVGATYGVGTVIEHAGVKMLEVPLWRSYLAGCILLGIAPCTAMVLVWGHLAKGNAGHTLVMVAINSLTMLFLYGPLGGFLLGVGKLPVPWQALLLSISIYVALPLVAGFLSRRWIITRKGNAWFEEKFLHVLTPITIIALLVTLVLLFSFKGETILNNPLTILWIAIPLFLQTVLIFALGYGLSKALRLRYSDAAPSAMIGASNHFEVAIATSTMLFGLSSGAALATVVGVLIEVPGDADAGQNLSENAELVRGPAVIDRSPCDVVCDLAIAAEDAERTPEAVSLSDGLFGAAFEKPFDDANILGDMDGDIFAGLNLRV